MDPHSHSFNMFANQMPGYYTPTPGGTNTIYHHQAGDLHTPSYGFGISTPLSLPTSEGALHAGHQAAAFHGFHPQIPQHIQHPSFHEIDPFHMQQQPPQQHGLPPHHFSNHPSLEGIEGVLGESPIEDFGMDAAMQHPRHSPDMMLLPHSMLRAMQPPPVHPSGDK